MIRGDERYWANVVLGAIENLEHPMLMYDGEKMIVRKALKAYLASDDRAEQTEPTTEDCSMVERGINVPNKTEPSTAIENFPQTVIHEDRDTQILDAWQTKHTDCPWK